MASDTYTSGRRAHASASLCSASKGEATSYGARGPSFARRQESDHRVLSTGPLMRMCENMCGTPSSAGGVELAAGASVAYCRVTKIWPATRDGHRQW